MISRPAALAAITVDTHDHGFTMPSDALTGAFLRTLAASKPDGAFLELGTGTGLSTAWILDGMDENATLVSVDNDPALSAIAEKHLGSDVRVRFHVGDGAAFLQALRGQSFDFVFADTWPGKYDHLDDALLLVKPGGFYLIDDMMPQANWPVGHAAKADALLVSLRARPDFTLVEMAWATGLVAAVKKA